MALTVFAASRLIGNMPLWTTIFLSPSAGALSRNISSPALIGSTETQAFCEVAGYLSMVVPKPDSASLKGLAKRIKRDNAALKPFTDELIRVTGGLTPDGLHRFRTHIVLGKPGLVENRVYSDAIGAEIALRPASFGELRTGSGEVIGTVTFALPKHTDERPEPMPAEIVDATAPRLVRANGGYIPDEVRLFSRMDRHMQIWRERAGILSGLIYGRCIRDVFLSGSVSVIEYLFWLADVLWDGFGSTEFNGLLPALSAVANMRPPVSIAGVNNGGNYDFIPEGINQVMAVGGVTVYYRSS